eukprot:scaffold3183_cov120-Isochrysis_galbana.AAC.16
MIDELNGLSESPNPGFLAYPRASQLRPTSRPVPPGEKICVCTAPSDDRHTAGHSSAGGGDDGHLMHHLQPLAQPGPHTTSAGRDGHGAYRFARMLQRLAHMHFQVPATHHSRKKNGGHDDAYARQAQRPGPARPWLVAT